MNAGFETIHGPRLDLAPFSAAFLRASPAGNSAEAERLLGARLPADWPTYPHILRLRLSQLENDPSLLRWLMRGMILRATGSLIGHGSHMDEGDGLEEIYERIVS